MKILVVDDDESLRELLRLHLRNAGHEVRLAEDAIVAGHWLLKEAPDLMIVDVNMPYMSGYEFVSAVRNDPAVSGLPVIFLSADEPGDERCRELGAAYLRKPILLDALLQAVSTAAPK